MIARIRQGLSLVELLVVIVIISILAALVLPSFKNVLSERKTNVAALEVKSFLEAARARAIARGRNVSVIFERLSSRGDGLGIDGTDVTSSNPPRSITAQNPVSGDASEWAAFTTIDPFLNYSQYNTAIRMTMAETLRPTEYEIAGTVIATPGPTGFVVVEDISSPSPLPLDSRFALDLVAGNTVELIERSGVTNRFQIIAPATQPTGLQSSYTFQVLNVGSATQPFGSIAEIDVAARSQQALKRFVTIGRGISGIRVYSQPKPLASVTNELPRGTCIDLSISGLATDEPLANYTSTEFTNCQREFASDWIMPPGLGGPPTPQQLRPVMITFSPSGNIDSVVSNAPQLFAFNPPTTPRVFNARRIEPNQDVFLFVGRTDQVVFPTDGTDLNAAGLALRRTEGAKPNMLDPTGYWIRISATNGSVAAAPTQAWHVENDVNEAAAGNPADSLSEMITESRALTFQSELSSQ
ncbi:MAG: prepilin-type N-terminal cleavage/methylation domain-containing protein [Planctomycetota bacterium]|nr:prepilin-type N-terminal cleavage/methylation domain-containing protein [Planctomycetota bacterium]